MLIVLSPAKSLDYTTSIPHADSIISSLPAFMPQSSRLIDLLKKNSVSELMQLMGISEALAIINKSRYASWSVSPGPDQGRPAIFAFNGDVYEGLDAYSLDPVQLTYLQKQVRILSGLYGVLRPFDLLQAYRLEMGTRLATPQGANLYAFWGDTIASECRDALTGHAAQFVINLASDEYFKSVRIGTLNKEVITPVFLDWKNDRYKIISFYAKRARGLMARYCAQHNITDPEKLKEFAEEGYVFDAAQSNRSQWVFCRKIG